MGVGGWADMWHTSRLMHAHPFSQLAGESDLAEAVQCATSAGRERLVLRACFAAPAAAPKATAPPQSAAQMVEQVREASRLSWGALSDHERIFLLGAGIAFATIVVTIGSLSRRR